MDEFFQNEGFGPWGDAETKTGDLRVPEKNLAVVRRISELFPVLEVSRSIMETFGELKAKLQKKGNVLSDLDLIIASTALSMNFVLVTNNVRHFKRIAGLTYENWKA